MKNKAVINNERKGGIIPVMMSGKNELEMNAMFISNIHNLLWLYRVNNRSFFSALINDPEIHPESNNQKVTFILHKIKICKPTATSD